MIKPTDIVAYTEAPEGEHYIGVVEHRFSDNLVLGLSDGHSRLAPVSRILPLWDGDDVRELLGVRFMTSKAERHFIRAVCEHEACFSDSEGRDWQRRIAVAIAPVKRRFVDHTVTLRHDPEQTPLVVIVRAHRGDERTATALEIVWSPETAADFLRREARIPAVAGCKPPVAPCGGRRAQRPDPADHQRRTRQKPRKRTRK